MSLKERESTASAGGIFFATKKEAEQELARLKIKQRREGENALHVSDSLRIMALECSEDLKPLGATLRDATDFYVKHLREAQKSVSVSTLAAEYLASVEKLKRSRTHQDDLRQRLGRFIEDFGECPVRTLTTQEIDNWLHALELSAQSINNFRSRLAAFFSYAQKRNYVERNPVTAIDKVKLVDKPPEIFTPEELEKLFGASPTDILPCLVLGAFAGLRTAEILRLAWEDIDLKRGLINVAASKSKTAKRRVIAAAPNLLAWLQPYHLRTGKVYPYSHHWYHLNIQRLRKTVGLATWPTNGLRHSFASYHLSKHQNAPQLALEMGHTTPRMIFDSYREVVIPEDADLYWRIKPNAGQT
jgi:integrase